MTKQSARCDYYRATTTDIKLIEAQAKGYFGEDTEPTQIALYGYKHTLKHKQSGAYYSFQPHTAAMGNMVQFSGTPITAIMDAMGLGSVAALVATGCSDWKQTRVDIAIDHFDQTCSPEEITEKIAFGAAKTRIRSWERRKSLEQGGIDILYGGSRESAKSIKIYDKAAEQRVEGVWTRLEMTFIENRAPEIWGHMKDLPDDEKLLALAKRLLSTMLDFPDWQEWQEAFGVLSKHEWTPIPRTESEKWRWLMKQVAPTFREAWQDEGSWQMLEAFVEAVKNG